MRVLFIHLNLGVYLCLDIGLATLSAILKKKSHSVKLVHLGEPIASYSDFKKVKKTILEKIKKSILDFQPGLIGISSIVLA